MSDLLRRAASKAVRESMIPMCRLMIDIEKYKTKSCSQSAQARLNSIFSLGRKEALTHHQESSVYPASVAQSTLPRSQT